MIPPGLTEAPAGRVSLPPGGGGAGLPGGGGMPALNPLMNPAFIAKTIGKYTKL